ncbi:PGC-1 and ERR-induced regulator in muscle protein 1 [Tachysurus fulvidraco]|uniref:PGC-1 and ERR-induced regulator in muscle protein 1 n=1 Tax=Tachysurus fulvidraco TaxID=1234273 RepID=UPI001FED727A|nr:PGC-1 and ERR-induced regulator in muscle protein 1 [Tachysurus fulvidraco]
MVDSNMSNKNTALFIVHHWASERLLSVAWHGPPECTYYPSQSTECTQDSSSSTTEQLNSFHFDMDDFEYSVQISELDWDSFFQACEECNMLPPGLARLEESGMSDMDDIGTQRTQTATHTDPELQTDALPDSEGSPVELYLSKYSLSSPDQVLSGSEDDFHLEAINVFFERLKSVSVTEDHTNLGSKMAGHSKGSEEKEDTKKIAASGEISQSCGKQKAQSNDCHTYMYSESTDDDREVHQSTCPDTELFIKEENWSLDVLKEGDKYDDNMMTLPDHEKCPCNVLVNRKELTEPNQFKEAKSQLVTSDNSDLLVVQSQAFNITPRRRRRKKKRMSVDMTEMGSGFEAHLPSKVSDSDEDTYGRRGEMVRETHIAEYCGSGSVTEAPSEFLVHPKKNSISENFSVFSQSVSVKGDMRKSIQVSPNLQEELSRSTLRVAQCKREIDMSVGNLSGTSTKTGKNEIRPDLKSPVSGVSVTETPLRDDNRSANTTGDNVGIHSQLNNNLPSEMLASIASSDVSDVEGQPVNRETLVRFSVANHTDDKSQAESTALQIAPLIHSLTPVYSKTPTCQFEGRVMVSDFQFDGSNAVGQRKTSTSCLTFPELTSKTFFSASFKNTERKEISSSVNHDEVPHENKSDGLPTKGCLSETFPLQLLAQEDQEQISHQINHKTQMSAAQISKLDELMDAPSVEPKAEISNEMNLKMNFSKNPSISNTSQNSQNEDWKEEIFVSLSLNNVPESQKGIHTETIQSPDFKGDRNEVLSLKGHIKEYQSLIHTIDPDSQLSVYTKSEPTLSNIPASSEEQKGLVLSEDKPPYFSPKDHDLSPTKLEHSPSPPPGELTGGAKSLETLDPDSVNQPTPPVYAISSFWNEMEKLTINDILRLRLVGQAQHPSVLLQPDDSSIADGTDAADSGYFTHSDESKPDHSSGSMTFISDFDGELAQLLTADAAKQDKGTNESPKPTGIIWESDPNLSGTATGMEDVFNLDTVHSSSLFRNNSNQCFRKMGKNISVQNLQALEGQNLGEIQRNASLHSIHSIYATHSEVEDNYVDPFDRVENSSPVYLSDEEEMESTGITFSEIFEYLFGSDEPKQSASETNTVADSYPTGTETSFPEMYDHFFSDFEPESFFFSHADNNTNSNDELVPIFSSSRSATRNAQFPEVYDYFFPDDSPVHSDEDEEPEHTVIRVVTRYDHNPTKNHDSVTASDPYKHIFSEKDNGWNFVWTNPFSFRRVRRTGVRVPHEESSSQALTPVKNTGRSFHRGIQPICILGADESPFPDPLVLNLENRIFRQLAEQQKIWREMQTTVADPRLDAPLLPIKQADMCLVCIAFASWVLKSVNPQGADTWKAVLLANISALSAIRYLRRFSKDEAAKISPLRQIKPV